MNRSFRLLVALSALCSLSISVASAQSVSQALTGRALPDDVADLCDAVNRPWVKSHPIPGKYPWYSVVAEQTDAMDLRSIIRSPRAPASVTGGDLSGLTMGFDALKLARAAQSRPLTRDDEQRFFRAWASHWRVEYTRPLLVRILKSDPHPPLQYRCTVPLSNFTPFYDIIGISPSSPQFLPSSERVTIW